MLTTRRPALQPTPAKVFLLVVVLTLVGFFVRTYDLDEYPFGVWTDEAAAGRNAQMLLDDSNYRPLFLTDGIHITGLQFFTWAAGVFVVGDHDVNGIRVVSAIWGTLCIMLHAGNQVHRHPYRSTAACKASKHASSWRFLVRGSILARSV